jgi:hypothetical protein
MRRSAALALVVIAGSVPTACASSNDDIRTAPSMLEERAVDSGDVEVQVTPLRLDATGATFLVVLDTHSVDLGVDLVASSTLSVGGTDWPSGRWDGAKPGGHHRDGELRFSAAGPIEGRAELTITGLPETVTVGWDVEGD